MGKQPVHRTRLVRASDGVMNPQQHDAKTMVLRAAKKDPQRERSMSVKLDAVRYQRLNKARFEMEMSGQEIFIEAIDMWFIKHRI